MFWSFQLSSTTIRLLYNLQCADQINFCFYLNPTDRFFAELKKRSIFKPIFSQFYFQCRIMIQYNSFSLKMRALEIMFQSKVFWPQDLRVPEDEHSPFQSYICISNKQTLQLRVINKNIVSLLRNFYCLFIIVNLPNLTTHFVELNLYTNNINFIIINTH